MFGKCRKNERLKSSASNKTSAFTDFATSLSIAALMSSLKTTGMINAAAKIKTSSPPKIYKVHFNAFFIQEVFYTNKYMRKVTKENKKLSKTVGRLRMDSVDSKIFQRVRVDRDMFHG